MFDLDSMTLLQTIRLMRDKQQFLSGRKITVPPRVFLDAAANPFAPPYDYRPLHLAKKVAAGADFIQIDEPNFVMYRGDLPDLVQAFNQAVEGVKGKLALHVCFGNLNGRPFPAARSYRHLFPALYGVRAHQLVLEFANREMADASLWKEFPTDKELGAGIGFHVAAYDVSLRTANFGSESEDVTAPLPVFTIYGQFALTDRWAVGARLDRFSLDYDKYEGSIGALGVDLGYQGFDGELRDLLLHLIAAHHGQARPLLRTDGAEEPPSVLTARAQEIALRFRVSDFPPLTPVRRARPLDRGAVPRERPKRGSCADSPAPLTRFAPRRSGFGAGDAVAAGRVPRCAPPAGGRSHPAAWLTTCVTSPNPSSGPQRSGGGAGRIPRGLSTCRRAPRAPDAKPGEAVGHCSSHAVEERASCNPAGSEPAGERRGSSLCSRFRPRFSAAAVRRRPALPPAGASS